MKRLTVVKFHEGAPIGEGYFKQVEEKMVLDITLKVLQNQQIRVSSTTNDDCDKSY